MLYRVGWRAVGRDEAGYEPEAFWEPALVALQTCPAICSQGTMLVVQPQALARAQNNRLSIFLKIPSIRTTVTRVARGAHAQYKLYTPLPVFRARSDHSG